MQYSPMQVQSNVMKKSWTTSSITSDVEREVTKFQSRDLIREYLLKSSTVQVPEIFKSQCHKSTFNVSSNTVPPEINLAYKHPLVLAEELKHDAGETLAHDSLHMHDNSSIIVPQRETANRVQQSRPHLIGNIKPSIARTWQQICAMSNDDYEYDRRTTETTATIRTEGEEEEDKQSYILFVRKPINFSDTNSDADFAVHHRLESEKFFDSIEECNFADTYEEELMEDEEACGGEVMASEIDSLEMRNYIDNDDVLVWSIES
jgi:hypothetical protein